jgi:glycosyltransferase involved in cell wall biosynthesis
VRVAICQPLIPAYRVPLFERLGALPNIDLTVFAGGSIGSLPGIETGCCYAFRSAPVRRGPFDVALQSAQVRAMFQHFDLIIAPWDIHYLTLAPALLLSRMMNVSAVLWGHGYARRQRRSTDALRNAYGRFAHAVLLYSRGVAKQLVQDYGFPPERVFVANNALEQSTIQAAKRHWLERAELLREFQIARALDPSQTLIFVSRLEPENRVDILLQATALLRQTRTKLKTVIVGGGSERSALEQVAQSLGIETAVMFTGPIYDELELAPWMLSSTVFCYPTRIGLSLLHAFGYGLPVITTESDSAQNPELEALNNGQNGLRYAVGDPRALASACSRLLDDEALRRSMSAKALATVADDYSMDTMVHGFSELFAWIQERRKAAGIRPASKP